MVQHNRIVIRGTMGAEENWSTSIAYIPSASTPASYVTTQQELNDWADDIGADIDGGGLSILRNALSTSGIITEVVTQKFRNDNTLERQSIPYIANEAGLGTPAMPPQCAIVISLLTGSVGASYRGRVYWPAVGAALDGSLRLNTPTEPSDVATEFATKLFDWGNLAPVGGTARPVVFSRTQDVVTPVTSIRVGNVCDTQRRRRDGMTEAYVAVDYP